MPWKVKKEMPTGSTISQYGISPCRPTLRSNPSRFPMKKSQYLK